MSYIYSNHILKNEEKSKKLVQEQEDHQINFEEFEKEFYNEDNLIKNLSTRVIRPNFEQIKRLLDAPLDDIKDITL